MNKKNKFMNFLRSGLICDLFAKKIRTHTRTINPKLGLLGLLGLFGFAGFIPKVFNIAGNLSTPPFFFFFAFFGFFGFYYEGKMSNTLIDERFEFNSYRASAIANNIGLSIIILIAISTMSIFKLNNYDMLSVLIATIGLSFGLATFLQQYLLYKLENEK